MSPRMYKSQARIAVIGVFIVVLTFVGAAFSLGGQGATAAPAPKATVTVTQTVTASATVTRTATATATATVTQQVPGPTTTVTATQTVAGPTTTATVPGPTTTVTEPGPTTTVTEPGPTTTVTEPGPTVTAPGPTTTVTVTQTPTPTPTTTATTPPPVVEEGPIMGVSNSPNSHGGTEDWDSWRAYTETTLYQLANRTGVLRPKAILYSKDGANLGGTNPVYSTVYNEVLGDLNTFYYNGTGNTQSARWGIQLRWSNGNEMHNKGALTLAQSAPAGGHTTAQVTAFGVSQKALYDAVHLVVNGQRRFPDAYAGSDPTTEAERSGWVAEWLDATAQWHDFVAWSIYPAGRKDTVDDPTFNWPSLNPADANLAPHGYMVRCFERVEQSTLAAGLPMGSIALDVGETGTGDDPGDSTTRPYWAVHGFMHPLVTLSEDYGIPLGTVNWWDNELSAGPQNILSDEPTSTSPSTRIAWQNWETYDHLRGGTHPSSWAGNPKAVWKTTGSVV